MANRNMTITICAALLAAGIGSHYLSTNIKPSGPQFVLQVTRANKVEAQKVTVVAERFHGLLMANGQPYNKYHVSFASNAYPLGTKLRLTCKGKSVSGVVEDRLAKDEEGIACSSAAFAKLATGYMGDKKHDDPLCALVEVAR